MESEGAKSGL